MCVLLWFAGTPSKAPEESSIGAVGNALGRDLAQPPASPGTYAAIATPFEGGSHSLLPHSPSVSGTHSAGTGPVPHQAPAGAGSHSLAPQLADYTQQQPQVGNVVLLTVCRPSCFAGSNVWSEVSHTTYATFC